MRTLLGALVLLLCACSGGGPAGPAQPPPPPQPDGGSIQQIAGDAGVPDAGGDFPDAGVPDAGQPASALDFDWSQYRYDAAGSWHPAGRFTRDDAAHLSLAWTASLGPYGYTQPMVTGDSVYLTTGYKGRVVALDASDGHTRWSRTFDFVITPACSPHPAHVGFFSAPVVTDREVIAPSPDGNLYALDRSTGATDWSVKLADPTAASHEEFVQSSPSLPDAAGRIYLGVASTADCDPVQGRVLSVDVGTHAVRTHALTTSGPGAPVWSSIAIDESMHRLFATSGDSAGRPLSDVPYSQAFLALDPDTLEVLDAWQNPGPAPAEDADFGASPTLFDAGGLKLVASTCKDGWLYVLRRDALSGGPLWTYPLANGGDPVQGLGSLVAPTFANGWLYAAGGQTPDGQPGSVIAFDPVTGGVQWRHTPPGYVMPAMPAVGDLLVVASNAPNNASSTLEFLDLKTGEVVAHFTAPSPTYGVPGVGRGLVVWYTFDGSVYAYRVAR